VLLPGDPFPDRSDCTTVRQPGFDCAQPRAQNLDGHAGWRSGFGYIDGHGCPSAAIALEELIHCGADTFIRIGTAGRVCDESMDEALQGVIVTGSVRDEGTTLHYIPIEYPALADRHIVAALADAAEAHGYFYKEGIVQCKDSFYGQIDPDGLPNGPRLKNAGRPGAAET
jgi:uridine phosphorylase